MLTIDEAHGRVVVSHEDGSAEEHKFDTPEAFEAVSAAWLRCGWDVKYVYGFTWMGRPVIQLPEDMIRIQEVIWRVRPDVIVETGVAHGGSLIFYASLFEAMGHGRVIGIDIDIRSHNRTAIEAHRMAKRITLVQGSSTAPDTLAVVRHHLAPDERVMVGTRLQPQLFARRRRAGYVRADGVAWLLHRCVRRHHGAGRRCTAYRARLDLEQPDHRGGRVPHAQSGLRAGAARFRVQRRGCAQPCHLLAKELPEAAMIRSPAMKAVILAGGLGTRISEELHLRPKPMIEIGGRPILWHVMNIYTAHGVTDFIICLGYRGYMIKEYFANYVLHELDVTVDARNCEITYHTNYAEPWRVTLVDTGSETMTGGRMKRVSRYLDSDESFCMTYGDGLADIDIGALIAFHRRHGKLATITAVTPPGRYGALVLDNDTVTSFSEKPPGDNALINGGFFVLHPDVLDRIDGDNAPWETGPLEGLARDDELRAYRHSGFWQPMDTLRDKNTLETLWATGKPPWKTWQG